MTEKPWENPHVDIDVKCPDCGEQETLFVPARGYAAWKAGELIQNALPELSADQREQLISGYHPECFAEASPPEEDEPEFVDEVHVFKEEDLPDWAWRNSGHRRHPLPEGPPVFCTWESEP